ncbi:MAG TPA: hypothetical protein VMX38_11480 [Verrucomicrobiae bacterium]|nr:hypothetical protein [Verrucomicrobiae bacterium]
MSRWTRTIITALAIFVGLVFAAPCFAAGGNCPTASNYVNPANPTGPLVTLSSLGVASCYFVGGGGSDTNPGTSKSLPWLHAPGMPNCTGTCGSASISAGTGIILQGGMTYHVFASTSGATDVPMGGTWTWNHSGTGSSPVYVGVDPGWYTGSSFARPIITQDNPLSTNTVSSCAHADGEWFNGGSPTNVIYDGFDLQGVCDTGANGPGFAYGSNILERSYAHGWTLTATSGDDSYKQLAGDSTSGRALFDVVDGADSTYGANCTNFSSCGSGCGTYDTQCATGWAFSPCFDVEYSVIRHVSNGLECTDPRIVIGNLFEYIFEPSFGGRHGNVIESLGGSPGNTCEYIGNLTRYNNNGEIWDLDCATGFIFNNVWFQTGAGNGNLILQPPGSSDVPVLTQYFFANNTADASTQAYAYPGNGASAYWAPGSTIVIENQHMIGVSSVFGSSPWFSCHSPSSCTETDIGGEVIMSSSAATAAGYSASNNFAPTSSSSPTVGQGINMTSQCLTYSSDSELCSGTAGAVQVQVGWGGEVAFYPGIAMPNARGSSWDAGAFQYSASTSGQPLAPTGLTAAIQ